MKEFAKTHKSLIALFLITLSLIYFLIEQLHFSVSNINGEDINEWLNPFNLIFLGQDTVGMEKSTFSSGIASRLTQVKELLFIGVFIKLILDYHKQKTTDFFFAFLMFFFALELSKIFYIQLEALNNSGHNDWKYSPYLWESFYAAAYAALAFMLIKWNENGRFSSFSISDKRDEIKYIVSKSYPTEIKALRYFHFLAEVNIFRLLVYSFFARTLMTYFSDYDRSYDHPAIIYFDGVIILLVVATSNVIFEKMYGVSWSKIITGSRVVDRNSLKLMSWSKSTGRGLSRLIPFDLLSFLSLDGWHDRVSKTDVVFLDEKKSVLKFNAFTEKLFLFLLLCTGWIFLAWLGSLWMEHYSSNSPLSFPLFLCVATLLIAHLITCIWFNVNSAILELMHKRYSLENNSLFSSYFIWILPILGFYIAKDTIIKMRTHIAALVEKNSDSEGFYSTSRYFLNLLAIFQIYIVLGLIAAFMFLHRSSDVMIIVYGSFILAVTIAIAFYRMSKKLSELLKILDFKVEIEENN
ncbi:MAG: hypothetical protein AB8B53_04720 [Flavobacteriales bacterium]